MALLLAVGGLANDVNTVFPQVIWVWIGAGD